MSLTRNADGYPRGGAIDKGQPASCPAVPAAWTMRDGGRMFDRPCTMKLVVALTACLLAVCAAYADAEAENAGQPINNMRIADVCPTIQTCNASAWIVASSPASSPQPLGNPRRDCPSRQHSAWPGHRMT